MTDEQHNKEQAEPDNGPDHKPNAESQPEQTPEIINAAPEVSIPSDNLTELPTTPTSTSEQEPVAQPEAIASAEVDNTEASAPVTPPLPQAPSTSPSLPVGPPPLPPVQPYLHQGPATLPNQSPGFGNPYQQPPLQPYQQQNPASYYQPQYQQGYQPNPYPQTYQGGGPQYQPPLLPTQQHFGPVGSPPNYQGKQLGADYPPKPNTYMLASILVTCLCCQPLSIIALVNASRVDSRYYSGDYYGAVRASEAAKRWLIWGVVFAAIAGIIIFGLQLYFITQRLESLE